MTTALEPDALHESPARDASAAAVPPPASRDFWEWTFPGVLGVGVAVVGYVFVFIRLIRPVLETAHDHGWGAALERPGLLWAAMGTLLLLFRTVLWFRYRPVPAVTMEQAPMLTVIIPAYNEGAMVAASIDSVASATYPRDRLEIFVVDDGSRDDTWEHIQRAAARHPGLVTAVRFPANRGKREALGVGFERARGEVVVTIDSDSVIEPDALLALAGPFRDPRVGAVAGRVAVYNRGGGIIPQMLHVRFVLSFDLLRAAQSTYGTVYCCPGALAAYRTSVVRRVLPGWLRQTFMGSPCTYGEDRALSNDILAQGFDTVYQRTAVVHTVVPRTYRQLCKMFLRWERSFIREEVRFARIVWGRPLRARIIALLDTTITNLRYPVSYVSLAFLVALVAHQPVILGRLLVAIGVMNLFNMLYYLRTERSWAFLYGVVFGYFSFFTLFWIFPYALVTVRSRSWMTR